MGEREFNEMYNTAIKKIAVGFYILDTCGDSLGYDVDMIQKNKLQLCGILAGGINLSITTIYVDARGVILPDGYIRQLQSSGLLDELIRKMRISFESENKNNLLDN